MNPGSELYKDIETRMDTVINPNYATFWPLAQKVKAEVDDYTPSKFINYMLDNYGVQIYTDPHTNNFFTEVEVVDEHKYLILLLKFA